MSASSESAIANECHSGQQPKRTPRPPNAFILYRSDLIRRKAIPPEVEKRQQNLSRIAGQCWNELPESEKAVWYNKATIIRAEYAANCPADKVRSYARKRMAKNKKRGATKPLTSCDKGKPRSRPTQSPYSRNIFIAPSDPRFSSSTFQAGLMSPFTASELPLPSTGSLSPLLPSHLLPSFAPYTNPSSLDLLFSDSEYTRNGIDGPPDALGSEMPSDACQAIPDVKNPPTEAGSSQGSTFQSYGNFAAYPGFKHPQSIYSEITSQFPSTLPGPFSPCTHYPTDVANNYSYGFTDNVHFNLPLCP